MEFETDEERLVAEQALLNYRELLVVMKNAPHGKGLAVLEQAVREKGFVPEKGISTYITGSNVLIPFSGFEWLIDIDTEPAARATAALNRIHDHYGLAQSKVKRAMQFVDARSAEMVGEVRRAAARTP